MGHQEGWEGKGFSIIKRKGIWNFWNCGGGNRNFPRALGFFLFQGNGKAFQELPQGGLKLGELWQIPKFPTWGFQPFSNRGVGGPFFLSGVKGKNFQKGDSLSFGRNSSFFLAAVNSWLAWQTKKTNRLTPSGWGFGFGPGGDS